MLKTDVDIKTLLDELASRYENEDFIKDDPVQFPHRYKKVEDIEIAGFIASLFAYGNRKAFIGKLNQLFAMMGVSPYQYIIKGDFKLGGFNYRFMKESDIVAILKVLNKLYSEEGGLAGLFSCGAKTENLMEYVCDYFYRNAGEGAGDGFYFAIPNPSKGGAMKRMWMFLRWMVRKSSVDMGVWKFMTPAQLSIPMDVHVARISRELGLLNRNANDKKAVLELTEVLRTFDANDPIKYDFALFGYGVNNK